MRESERESVRVCERERRKGSAAGASTVKNSDADVDADDSFRLRAFPREENFNFFFSLWTSPSLFFFFKNSSKTFFVQSLFWSIVIF